VYSVLMLIGVVVGVLRTPHRAARTVQ